MSDADKLRAQKAHSTDPDRLEEMAQEEERWTEMWLVIGCGRAKAPRTMVAKVPRAELTQTIMFIESEGFAVIQVSRQ